MIHPQRARAFVLVCARLHAWQRFHPRAEFKRRARRVGHMQRAALKRHINELCRNAAAVEMRLGLFEVFLLESPEADALTGRLVLCLLQGEAVMGALLDPAEV